MGEPRNNGIHARTYIPIHPKSNFPRLKRISEDRRRVSLISLNDASRVQLTGRGGAIDYALYAHGLYQYHESQAEWLNEETSSRSRIACRLSDQQQQHVKQRVK